MSTKNSTHAVDALQDVRSAVAAIASVGQYNCLLYTSDAADE